MKEATENNEGIAAKKGDSKPKCGIIMPISKIGDYPSAHWAEVLEIISDSLSETFECRIVSDSDDAGIIHGNIVQNVFADDIVVCDVSGLNSNVTLELGMRLAFGKPVVVIKDEVTKYMFDTTPIEYVPYPRDLRHPAVEDFKKRLFKKVSATHKASQKNDYKPYISYFGEFEFTNLDPQRQDSAKYIVGVLQDIQREIRTLKSKRQKPIPTGSSIVA